MKALIFGLAALPTLVLAGESIDKELSIPANGKVIIENQRGDVIIKTWDKNLFKVSGKLDDKAEGYKLETSGEITEFIVEMPKRYNSWGTGGGSNLTIYMPSTSELDFEGVIVDVEAAELTAGASIKTVNGNIKVNKISGKISLETVNGDIDSQELNGNIQFETVNGDIDDVASNGKLRFNAVNGEIKTQTTATELRLENVNGEVELKMAELKDLRLSTVNGEIELYTNKLLDNAAINMESVSGDIALYFPSDVSARFEINAHSGGRITNELSDDETKKAKYGPARSLEFVLNGGNADVEIDTVSGNIELKRK
ncbi:DUF4097 family beta strand repeat protein [Pseudoalteromonas sp. McH1-7]|uniref:DUF4097 family beta strand repeat-containing protein n=1 Tax=Pseudoalteromonas TaxID=53246 RepID=UPI000FFE688D|nr:MULTISPECIES: DUF4097 family beta strand repeat-containing protein [Pseudoalteromonas]MDW7549312.1 DUF4097 family beta strand repeat-containing protein [Pseudoalteromonas peptidolytica]NUZ10474.1 DUF4097 family beta strand repeat protein [Pseudoalteromonas sp. McH1-7]RXE96452.1 hypothetical protein D9603_18915 [Pseudoalteromonas sp. PS5]USD28974.1 DUF4097 family beta strand repeat protein [Pseudoalteromonas sp. SCSIO 43201]